MLLSAEATFGCIAEDEGLGDQWDWSEPGGVRLRIDPAEAADTPAASLTGALLPFRPRSR